MPKLIKKLSSFLAPLVCEDGKLSVGRVGLWILLCKIMSIVTVTSSGTVTDVPTNLLYLTICFIIYNFSKKVDVFVKVANAIWPNGRT